MELSDIQNLIMSGLNDNTAEKDYASSATAGINNLTRKRIKDLLAKFSSTGMGRSGIGGASMNDIYSNAGEQISDVNARAEQMPQQNRNQAISQLLGLQQLQQEQPGWSDVLGAVGGGLAGSFLGPLGAGAGSALGKSLFGKGGNSSGDMSQYATSIYGV